MIRWVPISSGEYGKSVALERISALVERLDDRIPTRNGQRAAGQEVVLKVNDDQRIA